MKFARHDIQHCVLQVIPFHGAAFNVSCGPSVLQARGMVTAYVVRSVASHSPMVVYMPEARVQPLGPSYSTMSASSSARGASPLLRVVTSTCWPNVPPPSTAITVTAGAGGADGAAGEEASTDASPFATGSAAMEE